MKEREKMKMRNIYTHIYLIYINKAVEIIIKL